MHYAGISRLLDGISFAYRSRYKTNEKLFNQKILEEVIGNPLHSVITLNPAHPAAAELLAEAGVGSERLDVPMVSMLRNDFLGTTKEVLDQACEENGVSRRALSLSRYFETHPLFFRRSSSTGTEEESFCTTVRSLSFFSCSVRPSPEKLTSSCRRVFSAGFTFLPRARDRSKLHLQTLSSQDSPHRQHRVRLFSIFLLPSQN